MGSASVMGMGRPQLPLGTNGVVRTYAYGKGYRAQTYYRDWDGKTRLVERHGKTKGAARVALGKALRDRAHNDFLLTGRRRRRSGAARPPSPFQRSGRIPTPCGHGSVFCCCAVGRSASLPGPSRRRSRSGASVGNPVG